MITAALTVVEGFVVAGIGACTTLAVQGTEYLLRSKETRAKEKVVEELVKMPVSSVEAAMKLLPTKEAVMMIAAEARKPTQAEADKQSILDMMIKEHLTPPSKKEITKQAIMDEMVRERLTPTKKERKKAKALAKIAKKQSQITSQEIAEIAKAVAPQLIQRKSINLDDPDELAEFAAWAEAAVKELRRQQRKAAKNNQPAPAANP